MRRILVFISALLLSAAAFGASCPALMAQIDARLDANGALDEETRAQVQELREEGEAHHRAGQHDQSMQKLGEAIQKLDDAEAG
jgi:hypothetical protein